MCKSKAMGFGGQAGAPPTHFKAAAPGAPSGLPAPPAPPAPPGAPAGPPGAVNFMKAAGAPAGAPPAAGFGKFQGIPPSSDLATTGKSASKAVMMPPPAQASKAAMAAYMPAGGR